jgi:hypothetical protein
MPVTSSSFMNAGKRPMPLTEEAQRRANNAKQPFNSTTDNVLGGVIAGGGRVVQGASGAVAKMADFDVENAKKADASKTHTAQVEPGFFGPFKMAWHHLTQDPAELRRQALANSAQMSADRRPTMERIRDAAQDQSNAAKITSDSIDDRLKPTGKVISKVAENVPALVLSHPKSKFMAAANVGQQVASEIGKSDVMGSLPTMAANAIVKGNTMVANMVQPVVEEGMRRFSNLFRKPPPPVTPSR